MRFPFIGVPPMRESEEEVAARWEILKTQLQKQMRDIVASKIDLKRFAPHAPEAE